MPHDASVYIIDDEPEMCRSLALLLSTGGVPARTFGSADLFLDMIDALPVGIIICDVLMPGTSGIELVRRLPQMGRSDPVVVIAGHADVPLAVEAMKAGALDFIEKPFEACTIMNAIENARRLADERAAPLQCVEILVAPRTRSPGAHHRRLDQQAGGARAGDQPAHRRDLSYQVDGKDRRDQSCPADPAGSGGRPRRVGVSRAHRWWRA